MIKWDRKGQAPRTGPKTSAYAWCLLPFPHLLPPYLLYPHIPLAYSLLSPPSSRCANINKNLPKSTHVLLQSPSCMTYTCVHMHGVRGFRTVSKGRQLGGKWHPLILAECRVLAFRPCGYFISTVTDMVLQFVSAVLGWRQMAE